MKSPGEGFMLDKLFYSLGYALEEARALLGEEPASHDGDGEGSPGPAPDSASPRPGTAGFAPEGPAGSTWSSEPDTSPALAMALAGWVIARIFKPRKVRWPRAILAGLAGTALAELTGLITARDVEERPVFPPRPEDIPRYAAGIVTAAAYAAIFYPRLPGSPLTRGLAFAAFEAAAHRSGGAVGLLRRVAPDTSFPLDSFVAPGLPRPGTIAGLAYGLGLALYDDD